MAVKCPGCQAEVPNVVPQDVLTQRLAAKDEQANLIKAELTKAAAERDALRAEVEPLKAAGAELAELKGRAAEDAAFAAANLKPGSDAHRRYVRQLHEDAQAALAEDKRQPLADWLAAAVKAEAADPLLLAMRVAPGQSGQGAPPPGQHRPPPPPPGRGTNPPPPASSSADDFSAKLAAFQASAAYDRSKPIADQLPDDLRALMPQG